MKKTIIKWTIISILFAINCVQIVELRRFREEAEATIKELKAEVNLTYDRDTELARLISSAFEILNNIIK